jgi:hypothetical protein
LPDLTLPFARFAAISLFAFYHVLIYQVPI